MAMFAESNMRPCYYREGHDIPVPLPAKQDFTMLRDVPPSNRKYVLTFKVCEEYHRRADHDVRDMKLMHPGMMFHAFKLRIY